MLIDFASQQEAPKDQAHIMVHIGASSFPISQSLHDLLSIVEFHHLVHWVTDGAWSAHELLCGLLQKTGPADIYISTYAFSEQPARIIAQLKQEGQIQSLHCAIDNRIDVRSASAHNLLKNASTQYRLLATHAKVTVIQGAERIYTIIGSANYTSNKRYEAGIISNETAVGDYHRNWISKAIENGI